MWPRSLYPRYSCSFLSSLWATPASSRWVWLLNAFLSIWILRPDPNSPLFSLVVFLRCYQFIFVVRNRQAYFYFHRDEWIKSLLFFKVLQIYARYLFSFIQLWILNAAVILYDLKSFNRTEISQRKHVFLSICHKLLSLYKIILIQRLQTRFIPIFCGKLH